MLEEAIARRKVREKWLHAFVSKCFKAKTYILLEFYFDIGPTQNYRFDQSDFISEGLVEN